MLGSFAPPAPPASTGAATGAAAARCTRTLRWVLVANRRVLARGAAAGPPGKITSSITRRLGLNVSGSLSQPSAVALSSLQLAVMQPCRLLGLAAPAMAVAAATLSLDHL